MQKAVATMAVHATVRAVASSVVAQTVSFLMLLTELYLLTRLFQQP